MAAAIALAQGKRGQDKQAKSAFAAIDWNKPFPAHKVIGNVYSVGSEQLGSFLITTPAGHILINSDYEETIPVIRAGVEQLGFKFSDIKILHADVFLGSHTGFYQMTWKYAKLAQGGPNPYIDPQGYQTLIDSSEKAFNDRMAELKNSK